MHYDFLCSKRTTLVDELLTSYYFIVSYAVGFRIIRVSAMKNADHVDAQETPAAGTTTESSRSGESIDVHSIYTSIYTL